MSVPFCASEALCRYQAGELRSALECVAGKTPIVGMASVADYRFYEGLCRAGLARGVEGVEREEHLGRLGELGELVEQFRAWAELCPTNHGHRLALLRAEAAETAGRTLEAIEQYDEAIDGALEQGHWLNHALACELAGESYLRHHPARLARLHLRDAIESYRVYARRPRRCGSLHVTPSWASMPPWQRQTTGRRAPRLGETPGSRSTSSRRCGRRRRLPVSWRPRS